MILSIIEAGIISNENVLRSGSVLVNKTPLSIAWLYRSAKPLMTKNFPSIKLAPGVRFSTSPVFLSGLLRMASAEITDATVLVFF